MTSASLAPWAPANAEGKLVDTGTDVAIRMRRSMAAVLTFGLTPRGAESCTLSCSEAGAEVPGDEGGRGILAGLRSLDIFRSFCGIWKGLTSRTDGTVPSPFLALEPLGYHAPPEGETPDLRSCCMEPKPR